MKSIKTFIIIAIVFLIQISGVYALSVDNNELTLLKGEETTVDLYATLEQPTKKVSFSFIFTSYDVPAVFKAESNYNNIISNSIKNTITFSSPQKGKVKLGNIELNVLKNAKVNSGSIRVNNVTATYENGNTSKLNSLEIVVKVGDENTVSSIKENNLLKEIKSDIVAIELKDNVYSYDVNISEDVTELDLSAVAKNESSKIEISSQKISELKDGKIIIKVTSTSNVKEEYTVNVNVLKTDKVEIDKEEFKNDTSYKWIWVVLTGVSLVNCFIGIMINKKER